MKELYNKEKELLAQGVPRTALDLADRFSWETTITSDQEYKDALQLYKYVSETEPKSPRQEKIKDRTLNFLDEKMTDWVLATISQEFSEEPEEEPEDTIEEVVEEVRKETPIQKFGGFLIKIGTKLNQNGIRI